MTPTRCADAMDADFTLSLWAVYRHPVEGFIARRWETRSEDSPLQPTCDQIIAARLDRVRNLLALQGLNRLQPQPGDDPLIIERWL